MCYKEDLEIELQTVDFPDWLEAIFFKVMLKSYESLLLCAYCTPQWQNRTPINFLTENLVVFQARNNCQHLLIVGDLNHYLIKPAYDGRTSRNPRADRLRRFPDSYPRQISWPCCLTEDFISCSSRKIRTSDHLAATSQLCLALAADESRQTKIWHWNQANWSGMKAELHSQDWVVLLLGNANDKAPSITSLLAEMQEKYLPARTYITEPKGQSWLRRPSSVPKEIQIVAQVLS